MVSAAAPGYSSATQQVRLTSGPVTSLEIRLESSAGSLDGQVTDIASGAPIAGATVSLAQWTTLTDATGHYRLERVPPGSYMLQVSMEGFGTHQLPVAIEPLGSHTLHVNLSPLLGLLRVRVLDAATGQPIEGATVTYATVLQTAAEAEEPCADYALLVPLKRSRECGAIRSRVSDLRPSDAWQQDGLHLFVFRLRSIEGDVIAPADPPVAVFAGVGGRGAIARRQPGARNNAARRVRNHHGCATLGRVVRTLTPRLSLSDPRDRLRHDLSRVLPLHQPRGTSEV